jgi:hypothetical protein
VGFFSAFSHLGHSTEGGEIAEGCSGQAEPARPRGLLSDLTSRNDHAVTTSTLDLLPGTEVRARGLRWEVVSSQGLGPQTLFRLRGLENAVLGRELDVLHPFETIEPIRHEPVS